MMRSLFILWLAFMSSAAAQAKDYSLIGSLPKKVAVAKAASAKGWDSGVTSEMKAATYAYNSALVKMITELAKAYYPADFISAADTDGYLNGLYAVRRFKECAANPSGEDQGTLAQLEVPSAVSGDLEEMIAGMVQAISEEDAGFKFKEWKKKWAAALK